MSIPNATTNATPKYFCLDQQYYPIQGEYVQLVADYQKNYKEGSQSGCWGTISCFTGLSTMACNMPVMGAVLCALGALCFVETIGDEHATDSLHDQIKVKVLQEKNAIPSSQLTLQQISSAVKIARTAVIVRSMVSLAKD
jgi:hypothetical protein